METWIQSITDQNMPQTGFFIDFFFVENENYFWVFHFI